MIRSVLLALIFCVLCPLSVSGKQYSLQDAQKISKETGRPILLYFGAPWCGPCQKFKQDTKGSLKKYLENNYLFVSIDIDQSRSLYNTYKWKGVPRFLITNSKLQMLKHLETNSLNVIKGYRGSDIFKSECESIRNKFFKDSTNVEGRLQR